MIAARALDGPFSLHGIADPPSDEVVHGEQQPPLPQLGSWSLPSRPCFAGEGPDASESSTYRGYLDGDENPRRIDLRLQIQACKLAFIVRKRRETLTQVGFTLRREEKEAVGQRQGSATIVENTIQEFLDRTRAERHIGRRSFSPVSGAIDNIDCCAPPIGYKREGTHRLAVSAHRVQRRKITRSGSTEGSGRSSGIGGGVMDGGGREDDLDWSEMRSMFGGWRHMTFVFCEELGWIFLNQATEEAIEVVKDMIRTTHCLELGIHLTDGQSRDTIEGLASAFSACNDISVCIDGAIATIAGTEREVYNVSRAIQAIDNSAQRLFTTAHWYYQERDLNIFGPKPWFAMDNEASVNLEDAFCNSRKINRGVCGVYRVRGVQYMANFALMQEEKIGTGIVRDIKRVITDQRLLSPPQCPGRSIPLTVLRGRRAFSLVNISKRDEQMVREVVFSTFNLSRVIKVQHIWNSFLWGHYAQNARTINNEKMLFHGAKADAINKIMTEGFEKRLAGSMNGAAYGNGCYFARHASLAARYMDQHPYCGQMIMAKVLVGEYTKGSPGMLIPPKLPSRERCYDTTTNNIGAPLLFVTYKDWQAYPMYLITFNSQP